MQITHVLLTQLTTEYCELEDRLKLSCKTSNGILTIWLTQRLCNRMLPLLFQWLSGKETTVSTAITALYLPQSTTKTKKQGGEEPESNGWLVNSINITRSEHHVKLTFKEKTHNSAEITFDTLNVERWLEILYEQYQTAHWAVNNWPAHIISGATFRSFPAEAVWH